MHRNPELEQAIYDAPEDLQSWSVYADWLQAQGDPWGERLSLGLAHADAAELDTEKSEYFLGTSLAKLEADDFGKIAKLEWEYGFIVAARVAAPAYEWDGTAPAAILRALAESPAARFLRKLAIGPMDYEYPVDLGEGVEVLREAGTFAAMRELFIGEEFRHRPSWFRVGDIDGALARMPNLRSLHVRGNEIGLGKTFEHAKLETLQIETEGLPAAAVKAIGKCRLPNLRKMEVSFGVHQDGGDGNIQMLKPLFTGKGVPKLEHLGLMNSDFVNDIARELARSPLLPRLAVVDLSTRALPVGVLHDVGGQAILDAAYDFEHLERLDLGHNYLSADMAKALQTVLGKIVVIRDPPPPARQNRDDDEEFYDDEDLYTEVGE